MCFNGGMVYGGYVLIVVDYWLWVLSVVIVGRVLFFRNFRNVLLLVEMQFIWLVMLYLLIVVSVLLLLVMENVDDVVIVCVSVCVLWLNVLNLNMLIGLFQIMVFVLVISLVQCWVVFGLMFRIRLFLVMLVIVLIVVLVFGRNCLVIIMLVGSGILVLCVLVLVMILWVVLSRFGLYSDLFMVWLVVVMKVLVMLLFMISWLILLIRLVSSFSLVLILLLVMIVSSGWVGVSSVLVSVFSLVISSGLLVVIGVKWIMLWVEVCVWCVVLNVFIMNMLYSVVYLCDSVLLFLFLLIFMWQFFSSMIEFGVMLILLIQLCISGILWFSSCDRCSVIGVSELVLFYMFLVGCFRCEVIIIVVFFFRVSFNVGSDVLMCCLDVMWLFLIGMLRFWWISMCLLERLRLVM